MQTKLADGAQQEVVRWRRERLTDSGFPLPVAARLANDARYDLHTLIELEGVARCPVLIVPPGVSQAQ